MPSLPTEPGGVDPTNGLVSYLGAETRERPLYPMGAVQSLRVCACVVKAAYENAILYEIEFLEKIGHSVAVLFSALMECLRIWSSQFPWRSYTACRQKR